MTQLTTPGGDDPPVYQWLPDASAPTPGDGSSWLATGNILAGPPGVHTVLATMASEGT